MPVETSLCTNVTMRHYLMVGRQVLVNKNGVEGITSRKTVMRAYYKHEGNSKYLVYDVFFNNDGVNFISPGSQQRLGMALLLPYKVMKLNSDGSFASDSVRNLSYAAYEKEVVEIVY